MKHIITYILLAINILAISVLSALFLDYKDINESKITMLKLEIADLKNQTEQDYNDRWESLVELINALIEEFDIHKQAIQVIADEVDNNTAKINKIVEIADQQFKFLYNINWYEY